MADLTSLRIGTRGSKLALIQAHMVADALRGLAPRLAAPGALEIVVISASGDHDPAAPHDNHLRDSGGKGLFTKELEEALLAQRIDIAVHSMKDVPTWLPQGLAIGGVLPRADMREAFVSQKGASLADLPKGARFGTSSLRRQAQLLALRPDLEMVPFRGNVDTRLKKLDEGRVDATMLAAAGMQRMGLESRITALISEDDILPAACQGIVGVEVREGDAASMALLGGLNCKATHTAMLAERALLAALDGSCHTPIGALARQEGDRLRLRGLVARPDGRGVWAAELSGPAAEAAELGHALGRELRRKIPEGVLPQ